MSIKSMQRWSLFWMFVVASGLVLWIQNPATVQAKTLEATYTPYYVTNMPTGALDHRFGIAAHPWWMDMHFESFIYHFKELQAGVIRLPVEWKVIEPSPGKYNWEITDRLLNRLNDEGFEVVAEFVTIPPWASNNFQECASADIECGYNPGAAGRFEAVVEATARRYPFIRQWEFWNEPENWPNAGREVRVYGDWLRLFYKAIKKADPTMLVGATSAAGDTFVRSLYDYIEATGGARNYPWDAIAYHPYNLDGETENGQFVPISKSRVEKLRQLMIEKGDGYKPMWITEVGFQSDPQSQADMLVTSFDWLASKDYISMIVLHMLHDWTGERYGLMTTVPEVFDGKGYISPDTRFVPKQPFYDTFRNYPKRSLPPRPYDNADTLVFPEIGHTVRGVFKKAWQTRGGLELFGYPKTGQFYERNSANQLYYLVQYFERARMEYHPELKGTPYEVQFGLLGNELMVEQGLLDQLGRPKLPSAQPERARLGPDTQYFRETSFNVSGLFLAAWKKQGGLAIVGLPRSTVFDKTGEDGSPLKIQYFERARIELHTGPGGKQFILFGLISNQRLVLQGRLLSNYQPAPGDPYNPAQVEFST